MPIDPAVHQSDARNCLAHASTRPVLQIGDANSPCLTISMKLPGLPPHCQCRCNCCRHQILLNTSWRRTLLCLCSATDCDLSLSDCTSVYLLPGSKLCQVMLRRERRRHELQRHMADARQALHGRPVGTIVQYLQRNEPSASTYVQAEMLFTAASKLVCIKSDLETSAASSGQGVLAPARQSIRVGGAHRSWWPPALSSAAATAAHRALRPPSRRPTSSPPPAASHLPPAPVLWTQSNRAIDI